MRFLLVFPVLSILSLEQDQATKLTSELRGRRQIYYLCGNFPNQYLSVTPCNENCNTCSSSCQHQCHTSSYCQRLNSKWGCENGCCKTIIHQQPTLPTPSDSPVCGGRETSGGYCTSGGTCGSGYMCNDYNICCRCSYGTSIGPCVNGQCPDNTYCSPTNNCCPYLTTRSKIFKN